MALVFRISIYSILRACPELVEGCPPALKVPQDWGTRELKKVYSASLRQNVNDAIISLRAIAAALF
jgi:hypothetical protein